MAQRIAQVDAALNLLNADLPTMTRLDLLQIMGVLKSELHNIPVSMRLCIMSQAFCWQFQELRGMDESVAQDRMDKLYSGIGFWMPGALDGLGDSRSGDDECESESFKVDEPSLLHLVAEIIAVDEKRVSLEDLQDTNEKAQWESESLKNWEAATIINNETSCI